jgi:hypothetical protein
MVLSTHRLNEKASLFLTTTFLICEISWLERCLLSITLNDFSFPFRSTFSRLQWLYSSSISSSTLPRSTSVDYIEMSTESISSNDPKNIYCLGKITSWFETSSIAFVLLNQSTPNNILSLLSIINSK